MHYDKLKTKPVTKKYIEGWNRIFNKSLKDKSFRKESKHQAPSEENFKITHMGEA